MKKVNQLIILLSLILGNSCTKPSDKMNSNEDSKLDFSKVDFEKIGIEHNAGLDYVFKKIKSNSKNSFSEKTITDYNALVNKFSIEYAKTRGLNEANLELIETWQGDFSKKTTVKNLDSSNKNYSDNLRFLLNELESVALESNQNKTLNEQLLFIKELEESSKVKLLSDNDKFIFLSGTAVARYSLEYWKKNANAWAALFIDEQTNKSCCDSFFDKFNWGAIGISDAGGAVSSAASLALSPTGAAMAATGPGGWVGIGLVVGGSAIISSGTAFAAQAMTLGYAN